MTRNYYDALDKRWSDEEVEEMVSRWREQESRLTARVAELEAFIAKAFDAHPNLDMDIENRGHDDEETHL